MDSAFEYVIAVSEAGADLDVEACYAYEAQVRVVYRLLHIYFKFIHYIMIISKLLIVTSSRITSTAPVYHNQNSELLAGCLKDLTCLVNQTTSCAGTKAKGVKHVLKENERDLERIVALQGPVSAAIDASHQSFHLYKFEDIFK